MFEFLFDLHVWVMGPAILVILGAFSWGGLLLVRRFVLPRMKVTAEDSEFSGALVQSVMVFYGLAVALIAVQVFETYSATAEVVSAEATAVGALYRDVSNYPEAIRPRLQDDLREYTRYVIEEAWPQQRRGVVPGGGVERIDHLQATLFAFEPATEGQRCMHAETLRAYNEMVRARRLRLDSVGTGIPGVMWMVIVFGAVIGIGSTFFFQVEDPRLHAILVVMLATFVALVAIMIVVLDRPYRGDLGVGPGPYQLIYDHLMAKPGAK